MLSWFDQSPHGHAIASAAVAAMAITLAIRCWMAREDHERQRIDWPWLAVILLLVGLARFPTWWVTHELNVDESQFIAGALALRHDPVFWRSLETTTSGPLNTYALLPAGTLLGADTYLAARLTATALIGLSLGLVHHTMVRLFSRPVARMAVVPAALFEAFTLHDDFLHYSSELVPMALLATALYLSVKRAPGPMGLLHNLLGGVALGAVPLAKLQAAPIAAVAGLIWVGIALACRPCAAARGFVPAGALVVGALIPITGFALMAAITGQWTHALTSYLANNLWYVEESGLTMAAVLADMARQMPFSAQLKPWLLSTAAILVAAGCALAFGRRDPQGGDGRAGTKHTRAIMLTSLVLVAISLLCIVSPRRPFPHYWQLAVIPSTLLIGSLLAVVPRQRGAQWTVGLVALLAAMAMTTVRVTSPHPYLGRISGMLAQPFLPVSEAIARHQKPGDSLSIWGWVPTHYVQNQLRPTTRDVTTHWAIHDGPYLEYYQRRYLADLQNGSPRLFLDALPPERGRRHEERFPALGSYISEHYRLVEEIESTRLYLRREDMAP